MLLYLAFHVAYLIVGFCGEMYSAVYGEKFPIIQSWPPRVGGEVLQCGLHEPYELASPLCGCPVEKSMLLNVKQAFISRLDLK